MYQERRDQPGKPETWTPLKTFEEAVGSGLSGRTATQIGLNEIKAQRPEIFEQIQHAANRTEILNAIARDMDAVIQQSSKDKPFEGTLQFIQKRALAAELRLAFAKSISKHVTAFAPTDQLRKNTDAKRRLKETQAFAHTRQTGVDVSDRQIDWDTAKIAAQTKGTNTGTVLAFPEKLKDNPHNDQEINFDDLLEDEDLPQTGTGA